MKLYVSGYSDDVVSWRAGRKQEELSTADASFGIEVPPTTLLRLSVTYGHDGCWEYALTLPKEAVVRRVYPVDDDDD